MTGVLLAGVVYSMPNAVWPATYAEYFPTSVRTSGMAIGTQFGFALAGFTPTIAGWMMAGEAGNWYRVAAFAVGACVISAVAVLSGPAATHRLATREVGGPAARCPGRPRARRLMSFVLGLVGAGIHASLTPALHEREGREQGLALAYGLVDAEVEGFGVGDLPDLLAWATRLGYDGLNITHPFKQAIVPLLDDVSEDAADLGAVNTVVIRDGRLTGHNTDWSGWGRAFRQALPERGRDRVLVLGAGGAGAAVGYALLEQGAEHVAVHDPDEERAHDCVTRLAKRYGDDRVDRALDVASALREADGLVNATPVGMLGHDGRTAPGAPPPRGPVGRRRRVLPVAHPPPRPCRRVRSRRARWRRHGRLPGGRRLRVLHGDRARRRPHDAHFGELTK